MKKNTRCEKIPSLEKKDDHMPDPLAAKFLPEKMKSFRSSFTQWKMQLAKQFWYKKLFSPLFRIFELSLFFWYKSIMMV